MLAVWLALLPRMVRTIYSAVHDELEKEYVVAARLDGASTLQILWYAVMPNIAAVLVTEFTRALSMAILDIAALGFLDPARSCLRRNGERCSAIRLSWCTSHLDGDAARRGHPRQRAAG